MSEHTDRLMTTEQAAGLLQVTPAALRQMRYRRAAPPAIKLGGRVRYRRSDVLAWIEQCSENS